MRRSASEIIYDLESRIANLEKSAIFGLFRNKGEKKEEKAMSLKERNLKRRQREEAAEEKELQKRMKARQDRLDKMEREAQEHYEQFTEELQYLLYKRVDDIEVDITRGNISGVITMGQFEYKIISELNKYNDRYNTRISIIGPGIREPKGFIIQTLVYVLHQDRFGDFEARTGDPKSAAIQIFKRLGKAVQIAHSDKAVSDRAEAKRMRKEKYRLANRRVTRLEKQSVKEDPRVPKVGDIVSMTLHSGPTIVTFFKVIEVGESVIVKELAKNYIKDGNAYQKGGILVEPKTKWARQPETFTSEEISTTRVGYLLKMRENRRVRFVKWNGEPKFESGHQWMY